MHTGCMSKRPSFLHVHLGKRLRLIREHLNLSPYDLVKTPIIGSRGVLTRLEAGKTQNVYMPMVDHLCRHYEVEDELRLELNRMAEACNDSFNGMWFEPFEIPTTCGLLRDLEAHATAVRSYEPTAIPGLLQTDETIAAIMTANSALSPDEADRFVQARLDWQLASSRRSQHTEYDFIVTEGALRTQVGGEEVHQRQLAHLVEANARPNVAVSVVPFTAGALPATTPIFMVLSLPADYSRSVLYSESAIAATYTDAPAEVNAHRGTFEGLKQVARPIEEFM